jgi:hypothetical protein
MESMRLNVIGQKIVEWVKVDEESRKDWIKRRDDGIKACAIDGNGQKPQMEGGATVVHPLVMEGGVQFQSRWIAETFPPEGPVKVTIKGRPTTSSKRSASALKAT